MFPISFLAFVASSLALPTTASPASSIPTSVNITLYTGTTNSGPGNSTCGYAIGNQIWQSKACNNIFTQGLVVPWSDATSQCTFVLYSGSTTCDAGSSVGISVFHLPQGDGEQCIATGVEDGGKWYHGSGIWTCS